MPVLLVSLILIPALAGAVCYIFGRRIKAAVPYIALVAAVLVFVNAVLLFGRTELGPATEFGPAREMRIDIPWLMLGDFDISLALKNTAFAYFVNLFIALFGLGLCLYSLEFMRDFERRDRYYAFMLWTLAGSLGAVLANNFIFFLICWEIVTVMLFLLVNLGKGTAPAGAAKSFAILGLSDCAMLLGIVLCWLISPGRTLEMGKLHIEVASGLSYLAFLLLMVGALAKAGAIPLHSWVPAIAKDAPTPVMAYLPASLDKLLGIYFLARISFQLFTINEPLKLVLMVIGAVTILAAVLMAMIQHELKKLLSFHAVSQVGYMVLGIGTGTVIGIAGGIFHMLNNAIYKCILFLSAGAVERRAKTTELDRLGGLAKAMPLSFVACLVAAMAISGIPPLNGFVSKWMIYQGIISTGSKLAPILLVAAVFGSALTLASFIKVLHSVFLGEAPAELEARKVKEVSWRMTAPMLTLAGLCLVFGVFAQIPLTSLLNPTLKELGQETLVVGAASGAISGVPGWWTPTNATGLILLGLVVGVGIYYLGKAMKFRTAPTFLAGERLSPEVTRFPGTGFYETIRELPGLNVLYRDGEAGSLDLYHYLGKLGNNLIQVLRRMHTGVLSVYAGWCVLGLILIIAYIIRFL